MKRVWLILLLIFVAGCSGSIGPSAEELEKKFAIGLPSIWKLTGFKVTAEENTGTKTQPDVRARFVANVEIARDLYSPQMRLGDTLVLTQTHKVGDKKVEIHGVARSRQNAGQWAIEFDLENTAAVNVSDKPLSEYGKYVLAGSSEEKALRERLEKEAKAEQQAAEAQKQKEREQAAAFEKQIADALKPGRTLRGQVVSTSTNKVYPIDLAITEVDTQARTFAGRLSWNSFGGQTTTKGVFAGGRVQFRENEILKRGDGGHTMDCLFDLSLEGSRLTGMATNCGSGKVDIALR